MTIASNLQETDPVQHNVVIEGERVLSAALGGYSEYLVTMILVKPVCI